MSRRWWVSWYQPVGQSFELISPWWKVDGVDVVGREAHVAAVIASDEFAAKNAVEAVQHGSEPILWRFLSPRSGDWEPFSERYPRAEWMVWPVPDSSLARLKLVDDDAGSPGGDAANGSHLQPCKVEGCGNLGSVTCSEGGKACWSCIMAGRERAEPLNVAGPLSRHGDGGQVDAAHFDGPILLSSPREWFRQDSPAAVRLDSQHVRVDCVLVVVDEGEPIEYVPASEADRWADMAMQLGQRIGDLRERGSSSLTASHFEGLFRDALTRIADTIGLPGSPSLATDVPASVEALTKRVRYLDERVDEIEQDWGKAVDVATRLAAKAKRQQALRIQAEWTAERRTRERDEARAALARQAVDVERGRALAELAAQIDRLRRTKPEQTPFGFGVEDIAKMLEREVAEVRRETPKSLAARAECADVIAGAVHLLLAHGGNLVEAVAGVAGKLRARLDLVDQGLSWDEAKAKLAGHPGDRLDEGEA